MIQQVVAALSIRSAIQSNSNRTIICTSCDFMCLCADVTSCTEACLSDAMVMGRQRHRCTEVWKWRSWRRLGRRVWRTEICKNTMRHAIGWKINYLEIGYPEFCQLIEQENRDPNKALGRSMKITVALQFACCVAWVPLSYTHAAKDGPPSPHPAQYY